MAQECQASTEKKECQASSEKERKMSSLKWYMYGIIDSEMMILVT